MNKYVRGYKEDAGVDIVLNDIMIIKPGFQVFNDLKVQYTPGEGEVAFLVPRGSTAVKGIFPLSVAIDTGYNGNLMICVFNASNQTHVFEPGDRVFGIVNLKLGEDRVEYTIAKPGKRSDNRLGSSNGGK